MLSALLSLLGCDPQPAAPEKAGVSEALTYPVLLIGQSNLDVRDSEEALISIPGASGLNPIERVILDSKGDLFRVTKAGPVAGQPSSLWSMGTSPRLFYIILAKQKRPAWSEVQQRVLEEISQPRSTLQGSAQAVARVKAMKDVPELIEAARESWSWGR